MNQPSTGSEGPVVLVVDDDRSVRRSLERLLRSAGWNVRSFESAEALLKEELPDQRACLIADVHLGHMSGLELQAALRARAPKLAVILISGLDNYELELEACRLGTLAFLRKPFDARLLLNWVSKGLGEELPPSRIAV